MDITLKRLQNVCKDIKDSWDMPNDSHTKAEYNGMYEALDMVVKHFKELKENEKTKPKPQYTYIYGDECNEVWDSFKMSVRDDNDRIKLQFVAFQEEGSYE